MAKKEEESKANDKSKAAENAMAQIQERFGKNAIMRMGEATQMNVKAIPTGCISLDLALGIGGVPRGRVIEIYGPEAAGKTTLAQHIVAEAQKEGGIAAFVDAEHALDPEYARKIGVNVDDLLISQPDAGEQALDIVEALVQSGGVDVVVIDSVAALTPQAEIDGEMGDQQMGLQARLMSKAMRKLTPIVGKSDTTVIFINQIRQKIGVVFGNPETTPGGNALKFYSSVRIEVRRRAQIKQGDRVIGNRVKAKIVKNKVAAPFRVTEFDIMYNEGISLAGDLLETGVQFGVIDKSGNTHSYKEEKLGVGRENAKQFMREHPKLMDRIKKDVVIAVKHQENGGNEKDAKKK